jgi:hypothetical protein
MPAATANPARTLLARANCNANDLFDPGIMLLLEKPAATSSVLPQKTRTAKSTGSRPRPLCCGAQRRHHYTPKGRDLKIVAAPNVAAPTSLPDIAHLTLPAGR